MNIKMTLQRTSFIIFFLVFIWKIDAQQKEGNIVEYFGKEKVNDVSEGEVIHLFKEGLILRTAGMPFNNSAVEHDPVFADVILNGFGISEGKEEYDEFLEKTVRWEPLQISENGEYNDPKLRRNGYLYLEYDSDERKMVLLDASGHTNVIINGLPHEGDHYDFGWNLIPVELKKGKNKFLLSGGRFPRMRARLLKTSKPVEFTTRDLTLPDLLEEQRKPLWGAIRIINTKNEGFRGGRIQVTINGTSRESEIPDISPNYVKKIPFSIPVPPSIKAGEKLEGVLYLKDRQRKIIDTVLLNLDVKSIYKHHKNTFISDIDGSVQYYSLAPSLTKDKDNQALFLSVHGASVEAVNQANAYDQKGWGHLVAPTNRRPFGFAWEDWGRLDALEVLHEAEQLLKTDPQHTYLTGHSMGGHGTWYLGATYPDKFAAIAPAAGYPDLLGYRDSFVQKLEEEEIEERFNMSVPDFKEKMSLSFGDPKEEKLDGLIRRAGNPSRTLKLKNNYLHYGVYILHGDSDKVVPTFLAREMREELGEFHNDFAYYEYPGGEHWFGDESVDWPPIFYFFKRRKIKEDSEINKIDFTTASPGVSKGSHFIQIIQQQHPFEISNFNFNRKEDGFEINTGNVHKMAIDLEAMQHKNISRVLLDGKPISLPAANKVYLSRENGIWSVAEAPGAFAKNPVRNGGFKDAFRNNMVFVYATKGSDQENEWYYNRARFDAEKFWYRANGKVDLIKDTEFKVSDFKDRNVIIYGNKSNNAAWNKLLKKAPIQVSDNKIEIGSKVLRGPQFGAYFIYPNQESENASIGVVTATGVKGMHAAYANDYLQNGTFYPDVIVFDEEMPKKGVSGVRFSGFFGNDWSVENGEFIWNK